MIAFVDTESTGFADFRSPASSERQPRLVSLAALLTKDDDTEVMSMNVIIKPDGFTIPEQASEKHGILTDYALSVGVQSASAILMFMALVRNADEIVCHNVAFDKLVIEAEILRVAGSERHKKFTAKNFFCTMLALTPICKLPKPAHSYGDEFKWPKLEEAYLIAFNEKHENAHNALADVQATKRLYFWLKARESEKAKVEA